MSCMKRLAAISTLLLSLTIPAFAQHGGGHGGGGGHAGGGGFSGHSGGSSFSGGARSAPSGIAPFSSPSAARPAYAHPGYGLQNRPGYTPGFASRFAAPGIQRSVSPYRQPYRSPNADNRRWNRGGVIYENSRNRQTGYIGPYFWPYPYGLGYFGDGFYDDSYDNDSDQGSSYDQSYAPDQYNGFDPQGAYYDQSQGQPAYRIQGQNQYEDQAQVEGSYPGQYPNQVPPGAPYQPYYAPQDSAPRARPAYHQAQSAPNQPAVTLVFKDNRPNQVIHNYLINGGTLTVWDQSAHDIPVADLNIEATHKINHDKGVDFFLPSASY